MKEEKEKKLEDIKVYQQYLEIAQENYQIIKDKTTLWVKARWIGLGIAILLLLYRVYTTKGYYLILYACGIYILNMFIGFLSPLETSDLRARNYTLPSSSKDGDRPFMRLTPEFTFWYKSTRAIVLCLFLTFFKAFDIPVFWPILLAYFVMLTFLSIQSRIQHMVVYKYLPWTSKKKLYHTNIKTKGFQPSDLSSTNQSQSIHLANPAPTITQNSANDLPSPGTQLKSLAREY